MSESSPSVRRHQRYPRSAVRLAVRISSIDAEKDPETGGPYFMTANETCHNLSRGGLYVVTHEPMRPGSRVLVEIEIPGGPEVQAIGRVAWSRADVSPTKIDERSGVGIEFLGGSREALSAVEQYVERVGRRARRSGEASAPATGPAPQV